MEGAPRPFDAVFVQSAAALTSGAGTLILHGLSNSTIYFAERPRREVGHIPSGRFVELWGEATGGFAVDPPSAVLSFLDDKADDVVVALREPTLEGGTLTYRVDVLEGTMPDIAGSCALFIDAFGRPLSRVSLGPSSG